MDQKKAKGKNRYWKSFQRLFSELDKGSPPGSAHGYNAFNGGLFQFDNVVDSLELPNSLFTKALAFKKPGKQSREITGIFGFHVYDFVDELDVDALGSIFEQSLKDIEGKEGLVRGKGAVEVSKRGSKGVFYTPREVTNFIVRRALAPVLDEIRDRAEEAAKKQTEDFKKKASDRTRGRKSKLTPKETQRIFLENVLEGLKQLRIHDPACGSGAFLIEVLNQLRDEFNAVQKALQALLGTIPLFSIDRFVLRNCLHGWDILGESVELAKLSVWLRTAVKNEALESLSNTITTRDSLHATEAEEFDIVVGNPPWGADLDGWSDEDLLKAFPACGEEKDSYAAFLILSGNLLKDGGIVSFIIPNSWLTTQGYAPFRIWMLDNFEIIEIVNVWKMFRDVNHDATIVTLRKCTKAKQWTGAKTEVRCLTRGGSEMEKSSKLAEENWFIDFRVDQNKWRKETHSRFETMYEPKIARELDRVARRSSSMRLDACCDVTVGIQVYHQRKVAREIIETRAFHSNRKKGRDWHPYINGNEVQRYYQVPSHTAYLKYSDDLCDKRPLHHYQSDRVLVQQIFWNRLAASMSFPSAPELYLNTLFSLSNAKSSVTLEYLTAVLNSRLLSACYERWANRLFGDKFPKVSKIDLARIPIAKPSVETLDRVTTLSNDLAKAWSKLRNEVLSFRDFASTTDPALTKTASSYWEMNRNEMLTAIGDAKCALSQSLLKKFVDTWSKSTKRVNSDWSTIVDLEEETDTLIAESYGLKASIYDEVIARAPEVSIADALLPR